jgi:hypothetical protein
MGNPIEIDPINVKLRRQTPEALAKIVKEIVSGEVEKPAKIKIQKDKPAYAISYPIDGEPDNIVLKRRFFAVVLLSKVYWSDPMDAAKTEKVEQRIVTLLRCSNGIPKGTEGHMPGAVYPEIMFVANSAIDVVKGFTKKALGPKPGCWELESVQQALVEFTAEPAKATVGKNTFHWHKPVMTIVRALTPVEYEYVQQLAAAVKERNDKFTRDDEIDDYEERAFGKQKPAPNAETDPVVDTQRAVAHRELGMDDDVNDEAPTETEAEKKARVKAEKEAKKKAEDEAAAKAAAASTPAPVTTAASDDIDDEDAAVGAAKAGSTAAAPSRVADDIDDELGD